MAADREKCDFCGKCVEICPSYARTIFGEDLSARELFERARKDELFWRRSGGGVTLSGGEILSQPEFAIEFLELCRDRNINTSIETCLFALPNIAEAVMSRTDFIQFDIKAMSPELHLRLTGAGNALILKNAASLLRSGRDVLVRYPLVPGCNDDETELHALGKFCSEHRPGARVELLRYHSMGEARYEALGREYAAAGTKPPEESVMGRAAELLREYGLDVVC